MLKSLVTEPNHLEDIIYPSVGLYLGREVNERGFGVSQRNVSPLTRNMKSSDNILS